MTMVCVDRLAREPRRRAANAIGVAEAPKAIIDVLGLRGTGSILDIRPPVQDIPLK
jgi:hypothetical protein